MILLPFEFTYFDNNVCNEGCNSSKWSVNERGEERSMENDDFSCFKSTMYKVQTGTIYYYT